LATTGAYTSGSIMLMMCNVYLDGECWLGE